MTLAKIQPRSPAKTLRSRLWFEKIMALLVLANYSLVIFNLTFIPLRDFWLQGRVQFLIKIGAFEREIPKKPIKVLPFNVAYWYDWVKGIEPYRETENYLQTVDKLNQELNQNALQDPAQNSVSNQKNIDIILANLQQQSLEMIDDNPFQVSNKTGTFERIKNKMREHIFGTRDASSKEAFEVFWSRQSLSERGVRQELNFFDREIRPLLETNYFRPVGENGEPVNNFGLLDFPFFLIFLSEFLLRTWYISRRHIGVSWFDAMLWRWYDIFLLIPLWRWLRIIPLIIRLHQAQLIDLKAVKKQASQGFVANIAQDITQVVIVQAIDQVQNSIKDGSLRKLITQHQVNPYIDINDTNETVEITWMMAQLIIEKVLPQIRPEAEAFLNYNIEKALTQTPAYQGLQYLPGFKNLQLQLTEQLVSRLYQGFAEGLQNLLQEDPVFNELMKNLVDKFRQTMGSELQNQKSIDRLEFLLTDLLEEIKINYVERLSTEDIEVILEQTRALRQAVKTTVQ